MFAPRPSTLARIMLRSPKPIERDNSKDGVATHASQGAGGADHDPAGADGSDKD